MTVAALLFTTGAAADQSYADPIGDATGGAPDIGAVQVTNDAAGTITFAVGVAGVPAAEAYVDLWIDADRNLATGEDGDDFNIFLDGAGLGAYGRRWSGSSWVEWVPTSGRTAFSGGVWTLSIHRSELNGTAAFDFYFVGTRFAGETLLGRDDAPNGTAVYTYTLTQPTPSPPPGTPPPPPPQPRPRTYEDASRLPSRIRYVGQSIKHVRIGENLYATMKRLGSPKVVPVACWSEEDWPSVVRSAGFRGNPAGLNGFWLPRQPRWLHLAPKQCRDIQALISTRAPNGQRAYALSTALHERIHADGFRNEAMTECFAVQLVYTFARELNFVHHLAMRLEQLAVRKSKAVFTGTRYWNPAHCRDGGKWDLYPEFRNLDY